MTADDWVDYYIEEAKREFERDCDYEGDREAFKRHIEEAGGEEGVTYLF